jgi:hypothetical protein
MSMDQSRIAVGKDAKDAGGYGQEQRSMGGGKPARESEKAKNRPFDEALEFSQSGSDDSIDTRLSDKKGRAGGGGGGFKHNAETKQQPAQSAPQRTTVPPQQTSQPALSAAQSSVRNVIQLITVCFLSLTTLLSPSCAQWNESLSPAESSKAVPTAASRRRCK